MSDDEQVRTFPFGRRVRPSPPSRSEPSHLFVLGAYPSGLHVRWTPPASSSLRRVAALIVDNEPEPFWNGADRIERVERWARDVEWQVAWGTVEAAASSNNGPSGSWVDNHILGPLGATRDDTCISDCLDTSRMNAGQEGVITQVYAPFADRNGLATASLQRVPSGETGIVREAQRHHARLLSELQTCSPERIVTLGNAAARVLGELMDTDEPAPRSLQPETYGQPIAGGIDGREATWLPLVHPRSGERSAKWRAVHEAWERSY